jgi:hypothetical protein
MERNSKYLRLDDERMYFQVAWGTWAYEDRAFSELFRIVSPMLEIGTIKEILQKKENTTYI